MRWQTPLIRGHLIRRYNRFLADITLEDTGEAVTVHCPNPGAMLGFKEPGLPVWVEPNDDPKKKLKYGWRLCELPGGHWAGIDTGVPNKVAAEAVAARAIPELAAYTTHRAEVKYGQNSRIDLLLTEPGLQDAYVEVKNVHLRRDGTWAEFPDSVTTRGAKHLRELSDMVAAGHRAIMLYVVQRTDCDRLRLAEDLDPAYATAFRSARAAGVEALCHICKIDRDGVQLGHGLPVEIA